MFNKFLALFCICISTSSFLEVNCVSRAYPYRVESNAAEPQIFDKASTAIDHIGLEKGLRCNGFNKISYNSIKLFFGPLTVVIKHMPYHYESSTIEFFTLIANRDNFTLGKFIEFMDNGLKVVVFKLSGESNEVHLKPLHSAIGKQLADCFASDKSEDTSYLYRYVVNFQNDTLELTQINCKVGLQVASYDGYICFEFVNTICIFPNYLLLQIDDYEKNRLFTNWLKSKSEQIRIEDLSQKLGELFGDRGMDLSQFERFHPISSSDQIQIIADGFRIISSPLFHKQDEVYNLITKHGSDESSYDKIFFILETLFQWVLTSTSPCFLPDVKFFLE